MQRCLIMIIFLITALVWPGCYSSQKQPSLVEQNWGRAFETARFSQTVNLAPGTLDDIEGIDGEASLSILNSYRQSFEAESSEVKNYNFEINSSD